MATLGGIAAKKAIGQPSREEWQSMTQKTIVFDNDTASKIERLLARCDRIKRGSDLKHVFDARGQREAEAIAEREARGVPPFCRDQTGKSFA